MLFQVRVEGFDYVGVGNSTNKKDAQANCHKCNCINTHKCNCIASIIFESCCLQKKLIKINNVIWKSHRLQ
jgi:hypothetical protein